MGQMPRSFSDTQPVWPDTSASGEANVICVIIMLMFRSVGKISFFSTFANGAWLGISATSSLTGDVSGGGGRTTIVIMAVVMVICIWQGLFICNTKPKIVTMMVKFL